MDLQTMAQTAMKRSGMRYDSSSVSVTSTDIGLEFITAVQDAWRDLQRESTNWWFRQKLDQTFVTVASTDTYAMPSGLETLNYRTVSIYLTAKTDETPVYFIPYEMWRWKDTVSTSEARPQYITETPEGVLQLWPVPDQVYTLRFDGVYDIDEMTANADTPGDTISGGAQLLNDRYHWILVWDAVRRVCAKFEDKARYVIADERYRAERARLSERQMPPIYVKPGVLTGIGRRARRF
jgi:hypothetical protein